MNKCSICGKEAVGMTVTTKENFHGRFLIYEFRCKEHINDFDIKNIVWTEIKGIGYD